MSEAELLVILNLQVQLLQSDKKALQSVLQMIANLIKHPEVDRIVTEVIAKTSAPLPTTITEARAMIQDLLVDQP